MVFGETRTVVAPKAKSEIDFWKKKKEKKILTARANIPAKFQ